MIDNIKVKVFSILVGWVAVALTYYYSFRVPSVIYTLINLDSVGLYLFMANLIISLFHLGWSFSCTILYKD